MWVKLIVSAFILKIFQHIYPFLVATPATSRISKWPYTIHGTSPSSSWLLLFPFQISDIPSNQWLILWLTTNSKNETVTREGKNHISFTESQNFLDLWRSSGPTPCLKKHHLGLIGQKMFRWFLTFSKVWDYTNSQEFQLCLQKNKKKGKGKN